MFITIRKPTSNSALRVTKRQYEKKYKDMGYKIVEEDVYKEVEEQQAVEQEIQEIEVEETEVDTVPIADMNKEQLMHYAKEHGIDTRGAKTVTDARKIIQRAVREARM